MRTLTQILKAFTKTLAVCAMLTSVAVAQVSTLNSPQTNNAENVLCSSIIFDTDSENPTIIKVGRDYYLTHINSSAKGFQIYQSRNLMQWLPITTIKIAENFKASSVNLNYTDGMFFIYYSIGSNNNTNTQKVENFALYADRIEGPWSTPFNLNISNADQPSHIEGENFTRFLLFSNGKGIEMQENGVESKGELREFYKGWHCCNNAENTNCKALRPHHIKHNGYYYQLCTIECNHADTIIRSTVIFRATKPVGPWERGSEVPFIDSKKLEPGLSFFGNAIIIPDADKNWWVLFNANNNTSGSNRIITMLAPVKWNSQGWPEIKCESIGLNMPEKPSGEIIVCLTTKN